MLILLDIDGVLVPANSWKKPEFMEDGFPMFSSNAVKALQRILNETNASVLLTTSHKTNYDVSQWKRLFEARGIILKTIFKLGTNSLETSRIEEILEWYDKLRHPNEDFVIIDDDKMLSGLPGEIKRNLVLTSSSLGLTEDLANEAISILQNKAVPNH
jgi:hypothetical protein